MRTPSVLLVDDHPPLRAGVAAMLQRDGTYEVAGEAGTLDEALIQVRAIKPDIVIADITLPDGNGIDLARSLKRDGASTRVLLLTMHARRAFAENAIKAGADGYLLKESTGEHLFRALETVRSGDVFIDPALGLQNVGDGSQTPLETGSDTDGFAALSEREYEVFRLLASGQNSKQIGVLLGISSKTVDNHRLSIMTKLNLESIADIVRLAIRVGIVEP